MTLPTAARSLYRRALLANAKRHLRHLRTNPEFPAPLLRALEGSVSNTASSEEDRWLAEIARLRERLATSTEELEIVDYGAGPRDNPRTEEEMRSGVAVRSTVAEASRASKDSFWGGLLFRLVREFRPDRVLELGTNVGVSAAYQAAAMELNGSGLLVTLEGAPGLAEQAQRSLGSLSLERVTVVVGRFDDTLAGVCEEYGPFDVVFIDGHHDGAATLRYFDQIRPFARPGAVLVFDDIEYSDGMRRAWADIQAHQDVGVSVGLSKLGICIVAPRAAAKHRESLVLA